MAMKSGNEWKDALIDACVTCCIVYDENDPRETILNLIEWHCDAALDPCVSEEAHELLYATPPDSVRPLVWSIVVPFAVVGAYDVLLRLVS